MAEIQADTQPFGVDRLQRCGNLLLKRIVEGKPRHTFFYGRQEASALSGVLRSLGRRALRLA